MSAAPVSRSSALPEVSFPSRRASEAGRSEPAFSLPPEPSERPRPRLDEERSGQERTRPDDAPRTGAAAETRPPSRAEDAGKDAKPAEAAGRSGTAKVSPEAEPATAGEAATADGGKSAAAAGAGSVQGKRVEERKAVLATALDGAPVIGKEMPEEQAAAGAAMQPPAVPPVSAEFLALAAAMAQAGEPPKPEGVAAAPDKGAEAAGETGATTQSTGSAVAVPVPPGLPARADGQASAGGEAAAADIKAGLAPQLPAAGADGKSGDAKSGDAPQGDTKTVEATPGDAPAAGQADGEAGKALPTAQSGDAKAAGEVKPADSAAAVAQTTQAAPAETAGGQQGAAPLSPQAILAAGPQSLTKPQPPLTELDAAAQATAHAQAEAAARTASAEAGRPTPLHVVPVEIGARALAGNKRFDIRLDPAELGRIDVRLEISDKGDVSAKLTVDRVETLQMLQRDARTLERAFEQAGLKPSEGGIDMSLRDSADQSGSRQQQRQDDETPRGRRAWVQTSEDSALVGEVASRPRGSRLGGVDLSI
ncbi:flagellar hook-length control protein FliK [Bosea sp. CS1GBMeth4]|uniref:flagellar hook-length control protein FliK n=1 Tax=Bosea sp. CS1GBMeth4 TaxID=1892849 RepID=UPI0016457559|nr:flagellar hook-length control protein FliK [Bosea sp. CS1GBMeth4]